MRTIHKVRKYQPRKTRETSVKQTYLHNSTDYVVWFSLVGEDNSTDYWVAYQAKQWISGLATRLHLVLSPSLDSEETHP